MAKTKGIKIKAIFELSGPPPVPLTINEPGTGAGQVNCEVGGGPTVDKPCASSYPQGTELKLVAAPGEGSAFEGFENGSGSAEACTTSPCGPFKLEAASELDAKFNPIGRTLTIVEPGSGTGSVECKFNGGSFGPCTSPQPNGTAVVVKATAGGGSELAGLSGTGSATGNCSGSTCTFTIEANSSVTATFNLAAKPKFKLTVTKPGTGAGTVTSTPAGINCGSGAGCEAEFEEGVEVTLNQSPAAGSEFKEWTGACSGSGACKVTMSAAKAVGAVFSPIPRTLTIVEPGSGTGSVECKFNGGSFGPCTSPQPNGTAVVVKATAGGGSELAGLSGTGSATGNCSGSTCTFTIEANSSLTATFNLTVKPKFKLTVSKSGTGAGTVTSTPAGINCGSGAGCEAEFEEGVEVTLNQSPAAGSEFKEWTGACSGSGACKVTMSAAKAVGAVFSPIPRTLTIAKAGTGSGEVKCKFNGGTAGACTSPQPNATAVEVIASANPGSTFAAYSAGSGSASSCTTSPCSFALEANSTLTATFNLTVKPKFKLTVTKSGTGAGTVKGGSPAEPNTIACGTGTGCEHEYEEGALVTLSHEAPAGSEFVKWTGACSGSGACEVTMSSAKAVGAEFNPIPRTLAITKAGTGTGEVKCKFNGAAAGACTSPQPNATAVEVIVSANPGSTFAGFSAATGSASSCSTSPCSFALEANSALTATFNLSVKPKFKLTVTKSGTGIGTVTSTPAGINCGSGANCEAEFEEGTVVTLSQSASAGSEFKEWTGACTGSGACKVTMSAAKAVGAKFEAKPTHEYTLTIEITGSGSGLVNCDGGACAATYKEGTKVTLSATALPGSAFAGWSGAGCSGTATCKVTISADKEVKAEFKLSAKTKFKLTVTKSGPGRVTSTPAGIDCGTTCAAEFEAGKLVELKQEASPGFQFTGWSGACAGTGACKVTMSQARSVGASFAPTRCRRGFHRSWFKGRPHCGRGHGHDSHRRQGKGARARPSAGWLESWIGGVL